MFSSSAMNSAIELAIILSCLNFLKGVTGWIVEMSGNSLLWLLFLGFTVIHSLNMGFAVLKPDFLASSGAHDFIHANTIHQD